MSPVIKLSSPATREFWEIPVLYEDEHLLALDKPSGLLTSADRLDPSRPSLIGLLHAAIADAKPSVRERNLTYLMNAHRPDPETSGILLLAKNKPGLILLANIFGSEKPSWKYAVLVKGAPTEKRFEVDAKVGGVPAAAGFMRVDPRHGKRARTIFEVQESFDGWTLLRAEPLTNRAHQIRAHLRHAGLPIAGDQLYGGKPLWLSRLKSGYHLKPNQVERPLLSRVALHAEELSLPHPVAGSAVQIRAPWPKDLTVALKYLRRYALPPAG
jgi:RluA family pseudouridine synthase